MTLKLGVLVSGSGSNMQAILDAIDAGTLDAECKVVLSNRPGAFALERATKAGIKTVALDHKDFKNREDFDAKVVAELKEAGVEWIALAGFMRVLTPVTVVPAPVMDAGWDGTSGTGTLGLTWVETSRSSATALTLTAGLAMASSPLFWRLGWGDE